MHVYFCKSQRFLIPQVFGTKKCQETQSNHEIHQTNINIALNGLVSE